ncbi:hypothetical protein ACSNOD_31475, partial [Streptomyces sp. URMC 123]
MTDSPESQAGSQAGSPRPAESPDGSPRPAAAGGPTRRALLSATGALGTAAALGSYPAAAHAAGTGTESGIESGNGPAVFDPAPARA